MKALLQAKYYFVTESIDTLFPILFWSPWARCLSQGKYFKTDRKQNFLCFRKHLFFWLPNKTLTEKSWTCTIGNGLGLLSSKFPVCLCWNRKRGADSSVPHSSLSPLLYPVKLSHINSQLIAQDRMCHGSQNSKTRYILSLAASALFYQAFLCVGVQ